jgi:hypothetical protein
MPSTDRSQLAKDFYVAFASGNRDFAERTLAEDFRFSSPVDLDLDRDGFFDRCWPGAGRGQRFEFVRLVDAGDELIVTYEMTRADGGRGRNTEVLTFKGDQIARAEVYFGWNLP